MFFEILPIQRLGFFQENSSWGGQPQKEKSMSIIYKLNKRNNHGNINSSLKTIILLIELGTAILTLLTIVLRN